MLYMATFTINIPQMLAYIPYMDPMGYENPSISRPPMTIEIINVIIPVNKYQS